MKIEIKMLKLNTYKNSLVIFLIICATVKGYGQNQTINGTLSVKSRVNISGSTNQILHLRPNAGYAGYIYWAENGKAERGILGFNAGSGDLVYRSAATGFSNGVERFRIAQNGNVGIGTSSPMALIDIKAPYGTSKFPTISGKGDILQLLTSGNNGIEIGSASTSNERKSWILARHSSNSYGKYYSTLHLQPDVGDMSMYKGIAIGYRPNAHVNSGFYLSVNGKIESEEIKVQDVEGADFVFASNYNLMSLSQIEDFIKQNHHLPEVPSAAQMQANGVELGKMNMLLLQKIEELTLLMIQQQKQLENQNSKIETQNTVISTFIKNQEK